MNDLGKRISSQRRRQGWTQAELGTRLNVTAQAVSKWENNISEPDVQTLLNMASLFGVSLDEMLNEQQEMQEPRKDVAEPYQPQPTQYRFAYNSGRQLQFYQADFDHGYYEKRKVKRSNSHEVFGNRCKTMETVLKSIGAHYSVPLQADLAGCFFENSTQKFFGFYYGGSIQFLCPCENFINVELSDSGNSLSYGRQLLTEVGLGANGIRSVGIGSMPRANLNSPNSYVLIISYFDETGEVQEFRFRLHCSRLYTLLEDKPDDETARREIVSSTTRSQLTKIIARLRSYAAVTSRIQDGTITVNPIDKENILGIVEKSFKEESAYIQKLKADTKTANRRHTIFLIITIGLVAVIVLVFWLLCKALP